MLTGLNIENFAIVKSLCLDLASGMTAFTGETGAGKSIMIDALMLALGARADVSVIRKGEEKCDITASFQIDEQSEPAQWLKNHDLEDEQGEVHLRRVIYAEGRSKSYINGQPFPLAKLKELSEMLVHIHGQHQHQTLMQHPTHRQQLDRFAGHDDLMLQVKEHYQQYMNLKQELDRLSAQDLQADRLSLLHFQIEELSQLDVQPGEMAGLHQEHQLLHHAKDYLTSAQHVMQLLDSDEESNLTQGLHQVLHYLQELPQDQAQIKNAMELIQSALIQCEECSSEIQSFSEAVQLDPERLSMVEERMSLLHQMARKYHTDADDIPELAEKLQQELDTLNSIEIRISQLQKELKQRYEAYEKAALALRASREKAAQKLADEISAYIRQLGMPQGKVFVELTALEKIQAHGMDKVEYKVCTNPGTHADSLAKIASGGELSRISLAIQMITAQRGATPTLIFDEVDVGIGGAIAALVGRLLRKLGQRLQVFCVTHQPQVAAAAHHHFLVKKHSDQLQTFSEISSLDAADKIDEISRMLGGLQVTEQTRTHAQELIEQSCDTLTAEHSH